MIIYCQLGSQIACDKYLVIAQLMKYSRVRQLDIYTLIQQRERSKRALVQRIKMFHIGLNQ